MALPDERPTVVILTGSAAAASAASASASAAATSASAASTSATSAATQATAAAASAAAALVSQNAAATSASAADASRTAAEQAETNAETAETNAELAETNAESARDAAAASATAAGLSAAAALASENNAETAQTAAEAARDDAVAAEAGASAIAIGSLYEVAHSRVATDYIWSNGVTTSRRAEWTPGAHGAVGAMVISIPFEFDVPSSNPSTSAFFAAFGPDGVTDPATAANGFGAYIRTTGGFRLRQAWTSSGGSNSRILDYDGFLAAYAGQTVKGMIVFDSPNTATDPKVYINGVDASASFVASTVGSVPNWLPPTLETTKFLSVKDWPFGRVVPHGFILGALTAAEVLKWTKTGRLPLWAERGHGSASPKYSSNFAAGADSWGSISSSVVTGNVDAIGGVDDVLKVEAGATTCQSQRTMTIAAGKRYRITGRFFYPVANATLKRLAFVNDVGVGIGWPTNIGGAADTWTDFDVTFTAVEPAVALRAQGQTTGGSSTITLADILYLKDIAVRELGEVFKPVVQPIRVVADAGLNHIPGVLVNLSPITKKKDWTIQGRTNTNGNQQLLASTNLFSSSTDVTAPDHYTKNVLDDWCMNAATGTPTTTAGISSGAGTYKASGALATGRNLITLATRVLAGAAFWVGSNSTDEIQHTISGHVVD